MTTLSKPLPPSIETGALMLYMTWLLPAPVRMSDSAAVEKPLGQARHRDLVLRPRST
jgi:hypothetical protein